MAKNGEKYVNQVYIGLYYLKRIGGWTGLVLYRDSYVAMALSDGTKQKYINPDD